MEFESVVVVIGCSGGSPFTPAAACGSADVAVCDEVS